jgi:hypothetical protein
MQTPIIYSFRSPTHLGFFYIYTYVLGHAPCCGVSQRTPDSFEEADLYDLRVFAQSLPDAKAVGINKQTLF